MLTSIKTALISVTDKTDLDKIIPILQQFNINIISTGNTAKYLLQQNIPVTLVADYTGFPEILEGRVKTLHPKIYGGLLNDLSNNDHENILAKYNITSIDLVIVNLYQFSKSIEKNKSEAECIENIDIGGPCMIRAAAKNHHYKTIITDPKYYDELVDELSEHLGSTTLAFRQKMAKNAFVTTALYDSQISNWLPVNQPSTHQTNFPEIFNITGKLEQQLRYGENPHQSGALYRTGNQPLLTNMQIHGKELSYNNIIDAESAIMLIAEFNDPTAAIIKHTNPCGIASGNNITDAYLKALTCDKLSAFGGIVALNRNLDLTTATYINKIFTEVIIAPSIDEAAYELLIKKKNLRILINDQYKLSDYSVQSVTGGFLLQEADKLELIKDQFKIVTIIKPTEQQLNDLVFAFKVAKHVKSNAIVLTENEAAIGVGAGQMSRIDSVNIAINKVLNNLENYSRLDSAVLASDAFFPFADNILLAAKHNIKAIIQPGGSVQDATVIEAANNAGISMVFTGIRHFKH